MKKLLQKLKSLFVKKKLCTVTYTYYVNSQPNNRREYQRLLFTDDSITATNYGYFFEPPLVNAGKCTIVDIKVDIVPTAKNYS